MTVFQKSLITPPVDEVTQALYMQLMSVMGLKHQNWITRLLNPFFRPPAQHLSNLLVNLDSDIGTIGWYPAVKKFLPNFATETQIQGEVNIPLEGPLIVASNHPAAYDIVVILSAVRRNDVKIIHSDIAILQMLPHVANHGIPVPYNIPFRLQTIRDTIRHLENGGMIFIFPRGDVEPDPKVSPGAEKSLTKWSPSIELFLRRVPETKTIVCICSGMLSRKWFNNPLIKRWKKYEQRQKVAEIFQIASLLLTKKKPAIIPRVDFSEPLTIEDLGGKNAANGVLLANITTQAKLLLAGHNAE